jgi:DNA polymerase-3 subunit gamma/tau
LEGKSLDAIEIDGASNNSVEDIRKLRENAKYSPSSGKYKMYIIDEVHMLSTSAFNALLKILEEPPPHLMFVFATTEPHKIPATILSRCQRHEFKRIEPDDIIKQLKYICVQDNIKIDADSLATISKKADGSMRDAQSILDQVIAFAGTDINYSKLIDALHLIDNDFYFRISRAGIEKNTIEMLTVANEVSNKGYDLQEVLSELMEHYRNFLTVKVSGNSSLIEASDTFKQKYEEEAKFFTNEDLLRILNLIAATEQAVRFSPNPKIRFELLLIRISSMDSAVEIKELIAALTSEKPLSISRNASTKPAITSQNTKTNTRHKQKQNLSISDAPQKKEKTETVRQEIISKNKESSQSDNQQVEKSNNENAGIESKWDEFVKKYATSKTGLFMLKDKSIEKIEFTDKDIIVYTKSNFTYESLMKNKRDFAQYVIDFTGEKYSVKMIKTDNTQTNEEKEEINKQKEDNSSEKQNNIDLENLNPVEKSIVDLFNAKRI